MTDPTDELPSEIITKVLQCLRDVDGEYEVQDMKALIDLVIEYGSDYPTLKNLMSVNEEILAQYYKKTGEVPPGVKLIEKTEKKDSNVIGIKIHHGSDSNKRNK